MRRPDAEQRRREVVQHQFAELLEIASAAMPPLRIRSRGFSAIELLVVLAIVAILAALAAPSFRDLIQNQRLTSTANDLFAAINLTRSEAIKLGDRVDLVPADGTDWAKGWIVYIEKDGSSGLGAGDTIVFTHGPAPDGMTIESGFFDSRRKYLAYNGAGRTRTDASPQQPQNGRFILTQGEKKRHIVLNSVGRPRVCTPKDGETAC
jgi:type IV fimbrial biogenesis protein FimT